MDTIPIYQVESICVGHKNHRHGIFWALNDAKAAAEQTAQDRIDHVTESGWLIPGQKPSVKRNRGVWGVSDSLYDIEVEGRWAVWVEELQLQGHPLVALAAQAETDRV